MTRLTTKEIARDSKSLENRGVQSGLERLEERLRTEALGRELRVAARTPVLSQPPYIAPTLLRQTPTLRAAAA